MVTQAKTVCSASTPCRQPSVFGQHRVQLHCNVLYWGCYFDGNYGLFKRGWTIVHRALKRTRGRQLLRNWLLIHTRRVHGRIRLRTQARTRLGIRNINNVPFNGTIDFDLLIKRLTGDGSWSEDHLILVERKKTKSRKGLVITRDTDPFQTLQSLKGARVGRVPRN